MMTIRLIPSDKHRLPGRLLEAGLAAEELATLDVPFDHERRRVPNADTGTGTNGTVVIQCAELTVVSSIRINLLSRMKRQVTGSAFHSRPCTGK